MATIASVLSFCHVLPPSLEKTERLNQPTVLLRALQCLPNGSGWLWCSTLLPLCPLGFFLCLLLPLPLLLSSPLCSFSSPPVLSLLVGLPICLAPSLYPSLIFLMDASSLDWHDRESSVMTTCWHGVPSRKKRLCNASFTIDMVGLWRRHGTYQQLVCPCRSDWRVTLDLGPCTFFCLCLFFLSWTRHFQRVYSLSRKFYNWFFYITIAPYSENENWLYCSLTVNFLWGENYFIHFYIFDWDSTVAGTSLELNTCLLNWMEWRNDVFPVVVL